MQIHELPAQTTAADSDVFAIDNGNTTQKITVANLGKKVTEDATPAFTSADASIATAWTNVAVLGSGEALKSILNKVSTMFKNIRFLYYMLGTTDISGIGGGTVTGAISKLNTDLTSLTARHVYVAYTISNNGNYNTNLKTVIDNDLPAGYRALGIAGYSTNNVNIIPIGIRYENSEYSFQLRSITSATITNNALIYYLCVKE